MSRLAVSEMLLARRIRWPLLATVLFITIAVATAEEPRRPDAAFDKLVIDTLRDVHNFGAEFYNRAGDPAATFRIYQGALMTVRPLLGHRPQVQKFIEQSLAEVEKEPTFAHKAYRLHLVIEEVRSQLRKAADVAPMPPAEGGQSEVPKKEAEVLGKKEAKLPDKKEAEVLGKKEAKLPDKKEGSVPHQDLKLPTKEAPAATPTEAPPPRPVPLRPDVPVDPPQPPPSASPDNSVVRGRVRLRGQPLSSGTLLWVSLDLPAPLVFAATVEAGEYRIAGPLPAGRYVVIVQGPGVPEKYQLTTTSGLRVTVTAATAMQDFALE